MIMIKTRLCYGNLNASDNANDNANDHDNAYANDNANANDNAYVNDNANVVKLLPLRHPPVRARTSARTYPSAQRATQLRSVLARVYAVSRQSQSTTTVP
jgi:hypothetical protein